MAIALTFYIIIMILMILFIVYAWHGIIISKKGKYPPYVPATGKGRDIVVEYVSEILENSDKPLNVLDPGCGSGSLILPLAKKFKGHRFKGIEWSYPYYLAKIKARGLKNVELVHDDMFKHDFGDADVIMFFVVEKLKHDLVEKIIKNAKKKVVVISIYVELPLLNLKEKISYKHFGFVESDIYVYELEPGKMK